MTSRALLVVVLMACVGCSATIVPPPRAADQVNVFVTDYGRHSSLLLPAPEGHYVEYAFGDWDWFVQRHTSPADAVEALFFSDSSALGRRQIILYSDEPSDVARTTGAKKAIVIPVDRSRVDAARNKLDRAWETSIDTVTFQPASQLWFARSELDYGLFYNCNHFTADRLRELGCGIEGSPMLSDFDLAR